MDKTTVRIMREEIKQALAGVCTKYGLDITKANARFTDIDVKFTLQFSGTNASGESAEAINFKTYADLYDMDPEWLEQLMTINGKQFTLKGMKTRRSKYQFIGADLTGKMFKFTRAQIYEGFNKKVAGFNEISQVSYQ